MRPECPRTCAVLSHVICAVVCVVVSPVLYPLSGSVLTVLVSPVSSCPVRAHAVGPITVL